MPSRLRCWIVDGSGRRSYSTWRRKRCSKPAVLQSLEAGGVACLAIDEAHCISSWGHDFRPEYRRSADVPRRFGDAVCIALTATATPRVQQDIQESLLIGRRCLPDRQL